MDKAYKKELLASSLEARVREVTEYQVNIDNFGLAIAAIGDDSELQTFKSQLEDLLKSSLLEQKKAMLMLNVVKSQME